MTRNQLQFGPKGQRLKATPLWIQMVEQPQGDPPTFHCNKRRGGGNGGLNSTGSSSSGLPPPASSHPLRKQERFFPAFPDRVCSCNLQTRGPAPVCTVPMDGNQGPAWVSRQASLLLELGKPVGDWTRPTWGKRTKTRLTSKLQGSQRFFIKESPDLSLKG